MHKIFIVILLTLPCILQTNTTYAQKAKNIINENIETMVQIETTKGKMIVKLYNETPLHRDNFVKLVKEKYYDSLLFHRVIANFMIQGGDPDSKNAPQGQTLGNGGPNYTIPSEFKSTLIHKKGVLSAARTADHLNPKKESSGSQFYIVQGKIFDDKQLEYICSKIGIVYTYEQKEIYKTIGGTPHLDGAYTVFGEVIEGLDVIDKIAAVATDQADRPIEDVIIISMTILP
ncbi:MAG: peptidylprolyl isomerase [Bacteroidales bacterium]|jgi:peptidyl-prolyl cis-trans isomerase B (cyclophilin B)|nr:peptidylprolyl isomerase [Bacteroidales bacterium]MDY0015295.1 peptidylprolyl isomerase [Bacteroidales bacterium]